MMSSFPPMWLAAFVVPGRLLVRLRVGILKFAPPCSRGDLCSAGIFFRYLIVKRGCCSCPIPCSTLAERACLCPSPRGWYRAGRARRLCLSFAFFVGSCACCSVGVVVLGVEFHRGGGLRLPACSCPSPKGWYRATRAMRLCLCRSFFVRSSTCCSVGVGAWGVEPHRGGGQGLPWIKLMCDVSMFPAVRPAAVVSPGRLFMRWRVGILEFARPCARGGFCDASGAEAG